MTYWMLKQNKFGDVVDVYNLQQLDATANRLHKGVGLDLNIAYNLK